MDNQRCTNERLRELALFAGAGGGILGGKLLGWRTICAVEFDQYAASVLAARQNDGLLTPFPIWDDVCTFQGKPWRGLVDVVSGGFPCQDISSAGKGAGIEGERSGLWVEMARIIGEVRPRYVFVENSPMLTSRGLGRVLGDLAEMGYDARWGVLGAADVGARHQRDRIWILADFEKLQCDGCDYIAENRVEREEKSKSGNNSWKANVADTKCKRQQGQGEFINASNPEAHTERKADHLVNVCFGGVWSVEPSVGRVANGVPARVDRLRCVGNGQVPQCMAEAWRRLGGE